MTILQIEDDEHFVEECRRTLQAHHIVWARTLEEGLYDLRNCEPDLVILDLGLPDSQGFDSFFKVKNVAMNVPVLIVSGTVNHALAYKLLAFGAGDVLFKDEINGRALEAAVCEVTGRCAEKIDVEDKLSTVTALAQELVRRKTAAYQGGRT